jgi:hypothetical protein
VFFVSEEQGKRLHETLVNFYQNEWPYNLDVSKRMVSWEGRVTRLRTRGINGLAWQEDCTKVEPEDMCYEIVG